MAARAGLRAQIFLHLEVNGSMHGARQSPPDVGGLYSAEADFEDGPKNPIKINALGHPPQAGTQRAFVLAATSLPTKGLKMFKSRLCALTAGALLAAGAASSAHAITITAGGYIIQLANYDAGTLYDTSGVPAFVQTSLCNSVSACNGISQLSAPGAGASGYDTQGIFHVTTITATSNPQQIIYTIGSTSVVNGVTLGPYLTGVFGQLSDYDVTAQCAFGTCTVTANAVGGSFALYNNNNDWNPTLGPNTTVGPNNIDLPNMKYTGITGGQLVLGGNFVAGAAVAGNLTASYTTSYQDTTIAGAGSGYLEFTSGTAMSLFHNNDLLANNLKMVDAFLSTHFDSNFTTRNPSNGWTAESGSTITGGNNNGVPEPGTLALVSLTLFGLGIAARRRKNQ
jgi:hypothetical protein